MKVATYKHSTGKYYSVTTNVTTKNLRALRWAMFEGFACELLCVKPYGCYVTSDDYVLEYKHLFGSCEAACANGENVIPIGPPKTRDLDTYAYYQKLNGSFICVELLVTPEEARFNPFALFGDQIVRFYCVTDHRGIGTVHGCITHVFPTVAAAKAARASKTSTIVFDGATMLTPRDVWHRVQANKMLALAPVPPEDLEGLIQPAQEETTTMKHNAQFLAAAGALAVVVVKFVFDARYNRDEAELKSYEYFTDIDGIVEGDLVAVPGQGGEPKIVKVVEVKALEQASYTRGEMSWVLDRIDTSGAEKRKALRQQFQRLEQALEAGRKKLENKQLFNLVKDELSEEDRALFERLYNN